jgi:DNA mismatch repair protein MutL
VHLLIEMPLDAVDVNVHPTKAEVRFRDQSFIHQVVRRAVADAVGAARRRSSGPSEASASNRADDGTASHSVRVHLPEPLGTGGGRGAVLSPSRSPKRARRCTARFRRRRRARRRRSRAGQRREDADAAGQFRDTFIVAVDDEGIAIIDQHVAHERILFERITERLTSGRLESQRLLEPVLVELSASGRQAVLAHAEDLDRMGFEIEDFGGESLRLAACPALLPRDEWLRAVRALAEDLDGLDRGPR